MSFSYVWVIKHLHYLPPWCIGIHVTQVFDFDGKNAIWRNAIIAQIPTHFLLMLKNAITDILEISIELSFLHLNFNNIPLNILNFLYNITS